MLDFLFWPIVPPEIEISDSSKCSDFVSYREFSEKSKKQNLKIVEEKEENFKIFVTDIKKLSRDEKITISEALKMVKTFEDIY